MPVNGVLKTSKAAMLIDLYIVMVVYVDPALGMMGFVVRGITGSVCRLKAAWSMLSEQDIYSSRR